MEAPGLETSLMPLPSPINNNPEGKNEKSNNAPQKIRYPPDHIKVYKTGGKRTASALCPFRGQQQAVISSAATNNSINDVLPFGHMYEGGETEKSDSNSYKKPHDDKETISRYILNHEEVMLGYGPSIGAVSEAKSNSDETMSHVSDVSDLSVISLSSSHIGGSVRKNKHSATRIFSTYKRNTAVDCNVIAANTSLCNYGQG